jgi:hypothetical protein
MSALGGFAVGASFPGKALVLGARAGNGEGVFSWRASLPLGEFAIVDETHDSILRRIPDLLR